MIEMELKRGTPGALRILCIGCHSDDIEIGCGGALLRLAEEDRQYELHWVVMSAAGVREGEARHGASLFGGAHLAHEPLLLGFQDGFMPYTGAEVKAVFEDQLKSLAPDLIFTHYGRDAHQDHRLISELTWNTFRDHLILEYEIPKYDGDLGRPNLFIPLNASICERKVNYLIDSFGSQRSKRWFEESTFRALMRLRGMECNSPSGYAEAFYSRKMVL